MATIVGLSSTGTGVRYNLGSTDSIFVTQTAYVVSTNNAAISGTGSKHSVTVAGSVYGEFIGIDLGDTTGVDRDQFVHVLAGGIVGSSQTYDSVGIRVEGRSNIVNDGQISGFNGLVFFNSDVYSSSLTNRGTITAVESAVVLRNAVSNTVINSGTLQGGEYAINSNAGTAADLIYNSGQIIGNIKLYFGNDQVKNRDGTISGYVDLGGGFDVFDNRGGRVDGTIYGGTGEDWFYLNVNEAEDIDGGADTDSVFFNTKIAAVLALDGLFENDGAALDDSFTRIERFYGSNFGNDVMRGDEFANEFYGRGGRDNLDGAGGDDVLEGGAGVDRLTGGTGNDTFRFLSLAERGDKITDFRNSPGDDDVIAIDAAGFGGGLVSGGLAKKHFQMRADNLAQDGNDRFIFRTTDKTLWFDADGNGSGAAVMIADLQDSATFSRADILLI